MNKRPRQRKTKDGPVRILIATGNRHKLREIRQILGRRCRLFSLHDLAPKGAARSSSLLDRAPRMRESGRTFKSNAAIKARAVGRLLHRGNELRIDYVLADDSGLSVAALRGAPGVRSARYAGPRASDALNRRKLLREMKRARNRSAAFQCVVAVAKIGRRRVRFFRGAVHGRIVEAGRGRNGFGYDPVFVPAGFKKTFGELGARIKNRLSHRAAALKNFKNWLREQSFGD